MQNVNIKSVSLLLAAIILAALCLTACCDKPIEPRPVKDYVFYFNDASYSDRYYRYHTASRKVDSLTIPYDSRTSLAVSADGTRLYLSDGMKTVVVSADSLDVITEIPYQGRVAVSPDNQLVAILGPEIQILKASDYSMLFYDTSAASRGRFSQSSKKLYCVGGPGVITIDLLDHPYLTTRKGFPGIVLQVIPSLDDDKWFLYRKVYTFDYFFEVYDVQRDSVVFSEYLTPGHGEIEITPDGRYAFYTNPGRIIGFEGVPFITVFDIEKNQVIDTIFTPSPVNNYMVPQNLAITPDGSKLVADGAAGQGEFSVIHVRKREVVEHYYLGNSVDIWDVTCQNAP